MSMSNQAMGAIRLTATERAAANRDWKYRSHIADLQAQLSVTVRVLREATGYGERARRKAVFHLERAQAEIERATNWLDPAR